MENLNTEQEEQAIQKRCRQFSDAMVDAINSVDGLTAFEALAVMGRYAGVTLMNTHKQFGIDAFISASSVFKIELNEQFPIGEVEIKLK